MWMKILSILTNLNCVTIILSTIIPGLSPPAAQSIIGSATYAQLQETEWNVAIMELIEILERDDLDAKEKNVAAQRELKKLKGFIDHLYYHQKEIQSTITFSSRLLETLTKFRLMETRHFRIPLPYETSPGTHDKTFTLKIDALVYDRNWCRDILARCYTILHQYDQAVRIVMDIEDIVEHTSEWERVSFLQSLKELARLRNDERGAAYYQVAIEKLKKSIRDDAEAKRRKEREEYLERTKVIRMITYALVLLIPGVLVFMFLYKASHNPLLFVFNESSVISHIPTKSLEIRGRTALRGFVTYALLYGAILGAGGYGFAILFLDLLVKVENRNLVEMIFYISIMLLVEYLLTLGVIVLVIKFRTYVINRITNIDLEKGSLSIRGKANLLLPKRFELEASLSKLQKVFVWNEKVKAKGIVLEIWMCLGASGDFGTVVLDSISGTESKRKERFEIWHEFFDKRLNYSDELFKPEKPSAITFIKAILELLNRILKS